MKTFVCDICGHECKATQLMDLKEEYQYAGMKDVCAGCSAEIGGRLVIIEKNLAELRISLVKRVINRIRELAGGGDD